MRFINLTKDTSLSGVLSLLCRNSCHSSPVISTHTFGHELPLNLELESPSSEGASYFSVRPETEILCDLSPVIAIMMLVLRTKDKKPLI